jgi:hypothetical protein
MTRLYQGSRRNRILTPGVGAGILGAPSAADYLTLPLTIHFQDETVSQTPTWVNGNDGNEAPYVESIASVEGYTKCLRFDAGSGATLGYGGIYLAEGAGQAAGLGLDWSDGLRIQVLQYRSAFGREVYYMTEKAKWDGGAVSEGAYLRESQETNPDYLRQQFWNATTTYNQQDNQTGINDDTGGVYTYTRWEIDLSTALDHKIYNTSGVQQGNTKSCAWPAGARLPLPGEVTTFGSVAGAGFFVRIVELWIGTKSDAWPAM